MDCEYNYLNNTFKIIRSIDSRNKQSKNEKRTNQIDEETEQHHL